MFRYLSSSEYDVTLERVASYEGETGPAGRAAAGVYLGLHGLRCGEICGDRKKGLKGLTVGDFDAGCNVLYVDTLKKGRARMVDIERRLAIWIGCLCAGQPRSAPILRTCRGQRLHTSHLQRAWRRLSRCWLGRVARFHSLRHTAAQRLYEQTKDMSLVQKFLGHRSMDSTSIYAASVGHLRDFMPKLPEHGHFQPMLFEAG